MEGKYERNLVLKERREAEGISREKLSAELGLDMVAVCRYELGDRRVPLNVRNALVVRYGGEEMGYRQRPLEIRRVHGNVKNPDRMNKGLRKVIYEAGVTPIEVCKIAGKSKGYLYHYISGEFPVSGVVAGWIAPIVGCSIGDLINSGWKDYLAWSSEIDINGKCRGVRYSCAKFSFGSWKDACRLEDVQDVIRRAMGELPDGDRGLLEKRFGFYDDVETLDSIGRLNEVVREAIRKRQLKALGRLSDILVRMGLPAHGTEI